MIRTVLAITVLAFASSAVAHVASKFFKGPNGGHIVDVAGGTQHWELVANGSELTLYVTDAADKPIDTTGGKAEATVLIGGKVHKVDFAPAGANTMKANGDFEAAKGMKVIVRIDGIGGASHQARLTPLK